jgi:hypothetical protein
MESIISFFIFFEQIKSEIWNQYREIIVSILCIFFMEFGARLLYSFEKNFTCDIIYK